MQKHEVTLDLIKETQVIPDEIIMRVGEGDTQIIEATLKSHGDDYDVPEGWMPALCLLTAAGNTKIQPAQAEGNIVTVTLADEMLTDEGTCKLAYIRLIGPDNEVQTTEGFKLRVQGTVVTGTTVRSWDGQLADLITEFEQQIELIKASEQVRIQNEGIRQSQEQTRQDQEATRQSQEATREENETARKNAEKLREAAETKRDTQEQARVAAEAQRETDEAARKTAESARDTAESERETQEAQRQANEQNRQTQEETRETKEGERDAAEAQRKQDETARQSQETTRESNESTRQEQEQARQDAEAARDSKEDTRDRAEAQRKANEIERQKAEMQRRSNMTTVMQNETERQAAEAEREKQQAKNNADQANNNMAAQGRITYICQEGEYDPVTHKPTIVGDLAHIYAVPLGEEATEANQYREWLWVIDSGSSDGRWEEYGSGAGTLPEPITTEEYDRMWAGETVESKHMAYAAGESYNVATAKAAIAKGVSDHDIAVRAWVQDEATAHEAAHAAVAAKIGTETVGAAGKPIYLENGVPVAIEKVDAAKDADNAATATTATTATTAEQLGKDTVGSETEPIYLNEGRPAAIGKVGKAAEADSAAKIGTMTVGDETKPVYFKDGVPMVTNIAIVTTEAAGFCPPLSGKENEVLNGKGDFVPIMAEPSLPDKRPLKALVASATEMHDGAFTSDTQDPTLGTWKSTTEAIQALQAAINAAQGVLDEYGESVLKQSELDAAQAELQEAIDTFKSQSTEVTANLEAYNALKARIDAVNEKAKESADGKDVTFGSQYVLTADKTTIDRALDACDVAIMAATKQSQIDSAVSTLSGAVSTYENAVKTATADYSALDAALAVANAAKKDVVVSEDGSELPAGSRYVTDQATLDAINTAVETATTARSEATTQKMLDDATAALTTATRTFEGQVKQNISIYGVEWDGSNISNTKWTRTDGAANFGDPTPAIGSAGGSSPFDNLEPWAGLKRTTRSGNEMVEIPKFWYKLEQSGQKLKLQIATGPMEGFKVSPAHMDRGDGAGERDKVYVGRYHCSTGYKSVTKVNPLVNITRSAARTGCRNVGSGFQQWDFATRFTIQLLYLVEYADWNSQAKIGYGCGNNSSVGQMGYTDSMQYHTGTTQSALTTYGLGTQYRWIEGLWDNVYDWVDGCYYNSQGMNIVLKPADFSDTANGKLVGMPTSGWPSKFAVSDTGGYPMFYPTESSGGDGKASSDSWNFSASSPCLYSGGSYVQNAGRGLFYVNYNGTSNKNGDIGSRLLELPS